MTKCVVDSAIMCRHVSVIHVKSANKTSQDVSTHLEMTLKISDCLLVTEPRIVILVI